MFHASVKKVLLIVLVFMPAGLLTANERYFLNDHSQVDHNVIPFNKIFSLMDDAGVRKTILSTRRNLKAGAI